ncbi:SHOCT domain-containing protein [Candidatus Manganitrophus noduliformans]|uniref:SHOCT domain-containing protein n=1 Tax=Candidatus Manganitrophus noduliformans TaxID=2606439 RepID=A0A7X6DNH0_9BACT|nr:SHOCT domain-containing protein [Candidatus Manganitrophus noduliformans]NKE70143.1 SHOCT domain-containing protein [Candidatus Manganitrophus noduliformans]
MMSNGMMGYGMGLWMVLNLLFWLLVIVGVVLLAVWAVDRGSRGRSDRESESALEILKKRYARGEISKEEYEEKKLDLI